MEKNDDFTLANEALENILGGANLNGALNFFTFSGANAVQDAQNLQKAQDCGCSCFCNDGCGGGGGAGN